MFSCGRLWDFIQQKSVTKDMLAQNGLGHSWDHLNMVTIRINKCSNLQVSTVEHSETLWASNLVCISTTRKYILTNLFGQVQKHWTECKHLTNNKCIQIYAVSKLCYTYIFIIVYKWISMLPLLHNKWHFCYIQVIVD